MKEFLQKLSALEAEISTEKGPFTLFAIFQREEGYGNWDLLVMAPWMEEEGDVLDYIGTKMYSVFDDNDMVKFSHIAEIDETVPDLEEFLDMFPVEHGLIRAGYDYYLGKKIKRAYIITARSELLKAHEK
jgi:hypothetical protein